MKKYEKDEMLEITLLRVLHLKSVNPKTKTIIILILLLTFFLVVAALTPSLIVAKLLSG